MESYVQSAIDKFSKYYQSFDSRPIFETLDEMLKWSRLYNPTTSTLEQELAAPGLSSFLIQELVTVITRINYGQSVSISGLAGAVSFKCCLATFVRGLLNHVYFGLSSVSEIPELVATIDVPDVLFTSIPVLKQCDEKVMTYKMFSREPMDDALLDSIFSLRRETIRIDWGAYPHYIAPEVFAPFALDGRHLYHVNAFENATSTTETSAVAVQNIARLIPSRFFGQPSLPSSNLRSTSDRGGLHVDL